MGLINSVSASVFYQCPECVVAAVMNKIQIILKLC